MGQSILKHSGSYGDIIYSIPAAKQLGITDYLLTADPHSGARTLMTRKNAAFIMPLLNLLGFGARWGDMNEYNYYDFDMDPFRSFYYKNDKQIRKPWRTIASLQCEFARCKNTTVSAPWIEQVGERALPAHTKRIIISRTARYHGSNLPWKQIMEDYQQSGLAFLGSCQEHEKFCQEFGFIEHIPITNAIYAYYVIRDCDEFYGNQSFFLSLAIGLGVPAWMEVSDTHPDCDYDMPNLYTQT